MAEIQCVESIPGEMLKYRVSAAGSSLTALEVARLWREDQRFTWEFCRLLALCPFQRLRWEMPVMNGPDDARDFECVVLNAPDLAGRAPDTSSFAEQFSGTSPVVRFKNLGGDALLVVPTPRGAAEIYCDLASFSRAAPQQQQLEFWFSVGEAVAERAPAGPFWLSTAGGGVAWLHVRLDDRPKYYVHQPYRQSR